MSTHDNYKMFGYITRKFKMSATEPPPDVKTTFSLYLEKGSLTMTSKQFLTFLLQSQREEGLTLPDAERIMHEVHQRMHNSSAPTTTDDSKTSFSLEEFFYFLLQDDLNPPIRNEVYHDMTAPLQHYFIYTGHNSYLTGNQLNSDCSEIPIIESLERGVRGIELDLWPNSAKDNILVLHGRTLTTPVLLKTCLTSIKEHAFVKSPYPVIITLEDHLTPDLQAKVAEMAIQIFGDMLYYLDNGYLEVLPSPEELKHRIILSTKPPLEYLSLNPTDTKTTSPLGKKSSGEDLVRKDTPGDTPLGKKSSGEDFYEKCDNDAADDDDSDTHIKKPGQLVAPEYKHIIGIHSIKPKKDLKLTLNPETGKVGRLSLSEPSLEKAAASHGTDLVRFSQKNILRVYPKGTRVTSSNFKPLIGWMYGAQMVAFNMQGYGKSLWMMHGMFRSNGGCGYVKKPKILMTSGPQGEVFDIETKMPVTNTLKVNIYLGTGWHLDFSRTHFDTFSPPDFYTKMYIVGVPADAAKIRTRIIKNEWGPIWDEEFKFPITVPELALLRIEIRDHDNSQKDDFGGQTCLPVSELKPGFRSVPLYDKKGEKLKSVRLLMRFQFV